MTREPNSYAQQRTYTVTQTMAISVPSVVAEDVLDGEDGGGMSAADSAVLYELQSGMVELKSNIVELKTDIETVESNVDQLLHTTIPTINANITKAFAQADFALSTTLHKSSVEWLTTPDYETSKLQIVPGSELKALQLTTVSGTATVHDLVKSLVPNIELENSISSLQFSDGNSSYLMPKVAYTDNPSDLQYCILVVDSIANAEAPACQLRVTTTGGIQTTTTGGRTWVDFTGEGYSDITLSGGLQSLEFSYNYDTHGAIIVQGRTDASGLSYYPLATDAFANANAIACQMKPVSNGIAYSNDYGSTWTTITVSSGADSESGSGTSNITLSGKLQKVNFSGDTYGNNIIAIAGNFNGAGTELYYYALAASAFANVDYPECQLKVEGSGLLYTTNGGQTWTAVGDNNSSSDAVLTLSGFAGTFKDYDATVLDYKLGLDLDPSTQQAYLIVKNGAAASWQPLTLGSDSSSGSTVSDSAVKLTGYINGESNLVTDLDYQLCLGKDTNSNLPYILVSNTEGNSWTTLIKASDREYLDAIRPITQLISDPYGSPIFAGSSRNTYQLIADNADLFGNRYLKLNESKADQLDTSAGSMSLSNMVWLSANASRLAELLPYIHS